MSSRSETSRKNTSALSVPSILKTELKPVEITMKLRDCEFMEFKEILDNNTSSVYDLMYSISKHHGGAVEPDKVQIYIRESENEYKPIKEISEKLSELNQTVFYYDFSPCDGSLLIIPNDKSYK